MILRPVVVTADVRKGHGYKVITCHCYRVITYHCYRVITCHCYKVITCHCYKVITCHCYKRSELTKTLRSSFRLNFRVSALNLN